MPTTPTDSSSQHGWGWLHPTEPAALQPISDTIDAPDSGGNEWQWINKPLSPPPPTGSRRTRVPRRVWVGLGAALGVAAVLVGVGINSIADESDTMPAIPTLTAGPPTTTRPPSGACAGLAGQTVTDTEGDTYSLAGVIAAFEHAYYAQRSAEAALRLVAPEAGLELEALAAGIASIPTGTSYCVAITPIADGAAEVHLAERHPDGQRVDYLQLINVRRDPLGVVITNIQKRG
ncbi:hypothetical protein OG563_00400 [Nocardia vinacea]|uniref:DUF8176 domain-containing protein n=1 Tax=Nocardia vinacea TaxID=96468 RepID=A0ABZ1YY04_9NOCA|nr:hypothetical protein [Nocardia vinacea]